MATLLVLAVGFLLATAVAVAATVVDGLRRRSRRAAAATCPGREATPNPCRCPCWGCRHHCSAHNPDTVPGWRP